MEETAKSYLAEAHEDRVLLSLSFRSERCLNTAVPPHLYRKFRLHTIFTIESRV